MQNKLNSIPLFLKVWITHILIYFLLLTLFFIIKDYNTDDGVFHKDIFLWIIKSPIVGLFGFLDGIGIMVVISIATMYLINLYFQKFYLSYVLALVLTYPVFMIFCNTGYGSNTITALSLVITIAINLIIFRKHMYKKRL